MTKFEYWLEDELAFMADNERLLIALIGEDAYLDEYQEICDVLENGANSQYYMRFMNKYIDEKE